VLTAVVVHHDTPEETRACLRSLAGLRVVVVDNGSAAPFSSETALVLRTERNLGFAGGCNLGIARALADGAEQILLLNSDAEVEPDCVAQLQTALTGDVGIVAPAIRRRGGAVESMGVRFHRLTGRMINVRRATGDIDGVIGCCALIRKEVFERAGLFSEELFYGFEDLDLCLRAARVGFRSLCVPSATAWHLGARTIGERSPRRLYFAARNHLRVAETAAPLPAPSAAARAMMIIGYNVAFALFTSPAPRLPGLAAVARGVRDHFRRRYYAP
jgi:GT2 family glycosyltransferase